MSASIADDPHAAAQGKGTTPVWYRSAPSLSDEGTSCADNRCALSLRPGLVDGWSFARPNKALVRQKTWGTAPLPATRSDRATGKQLLFKLIGVTLSGILPDLQLAALQPSRVERRNLIPSSLALAPDIFISLMI